MEKRDYYEVLGVAKDADQSTIKKAYRKLVKEYHPDVNKEDGAEAKFKEVQEAYETLSDDSKRSAYDQFGHAGAQGFNGGGAGFNGFNGYSQGGAPFDMGDIFSTFFGGGFEGFGGGQSSVDSNRGADIRYRIKVSFEEAMKGGDYEINIRVDEECEECKGSGSATGKTKTCDVCNGSGQETQVRNTILGQMQVRAECSKCHGTGKIPEEVCEVCKGTGVKAKEIKKTIKIPAGAYDGMVLRFRGAGNAGRRGSESGNLYIEIDVEPSVDFERRGNDIYSKEYIPVYTAVLGDTISVNTVVGNVKLKIPKGTQSGTVFRLKDKGAPVLGSEDRRGDHYVKVYVDIPKKLSKKEKKLWEELAQ
jgi:molecular chaperone DnaJ